MSLKPCAKCNKTVYPTEKLNCLDKTWHKACFKCEVCGMTLNMKNYKGYNKLPYCNAHYPTTKHTAVADTPENRRIAQNTKVQSQIEYHKDFEKQRGHKQSVADDPETLRTKHVQSNVSQIEYHHDRERRESMEASRAYDAGEPQQFRPPPQQQPVSNYRPEHRISGGADYNPSPYSSRTNQASTVYDSQRGGRVDSTGGRNVGSISDYDPMQDQWGSSHGQQPPRAYQPPPVTSPPPPAPAAVDTSPRWVALYDYNAADDDEVTFVEGDIVVNGEIIDEGWMTGTIQRTGQHGMLPANYVERL